MNIKLDSRIGSCAIVLEAMVDVVDSFKAMATAAIKQVVFHDSASESFKEKSPFKRDSVYSDELGKHVASIITAKLAALGFTGIVIATKAYVKPTTEARFVKEMTAIGFDAKTIVEMWQKHPDYKPIVAEKTAEVAKESATISLS